MQSNERIHALDTVRAFALITGILLHAAMSFMPGLAAIGFPADVSQSMTLQGLFYSIHSFRMPLFFLIAGFFARLMFHRKGARGFVSDRLKRILVPFLVGWLLFGPIAMGLVYLAFGPPIAEAEAAPQLAGFPLSHLWFLYYLLLFYVLTLTARSVIARTVDRHGRLRETIDRALQWMMSAHQAPIALAVPIGFLLYFDGDWILFGGIASPDTGLTPKWPAVIGLGSAFAFGWLSHRQPACLFRLGVRWMPYLMLAVLLTGTSFYLVNQAIDPNDAEGWARAVYTVCYSLSIWCWSLGLIGMAVRFFSAESKLIRYIADSSYWLYLAHLPLIFALQLIARDWVLHWSIKFPLIVTIAIGCLLLSYHFLVRNTIVGQVLNGRRYARKTSVLQEPTPQSVHQPTGSAVL